MHPQAGDGTDFAGDCRRTAQRLVGEKVVSARYVAMAGETWPGHHRHDDTMHEVDMGVILGMDSGAVLLVQWLVPGFDHGLEFTLDRDPRTELNTVDVTHTTPWAQLAGHPISAVAAAWHIPDEGRPLLPWSLRLTFANHRSVVIALGHEEDGVLVYRATSLLVFFDETAARSYAMPDSRASAWGEPLAQPA